MYPTCLITTTKVEYTKQSRFYYLQYCAAQQINSAAAVGKNLASSVSVD